eukprot:6204255-Pleurochrysis_carterae.AAC.2
MGNGDGGDGFTGSSTVEDVAIRAGGGNGGGGGGSVTIWRARSHCCAAAWAKRARRSEIETRSACCTMTETCCTPLRSPWLRFSSNGSSRKGCVSRRLRTDRSSARTPSMRPSCEAAVTSGGSCSVGSVR